MQRKHVVDNQLNAQKNHIDLKEKSGKERQKRQSDSDSFSGTLKNRKVDD